MYTLRPSKPNRHDPKAQFRKRLLVAFHFFHNTPHGDGKAKRDSFSGTFTPKINTVGVGVFAKTMDSAVRNKVGRLVTSNSREHNGPCGIIALEAKLGHKGIT